MNTKHKVYCKECRHETMHNKGKCTLCTRVHELRTKMIPIETVTKIRKD